MKLIRSTAVGVLSVGLTAAGWLAAQRLTFEVVSVKASPSLDATKGGVFYPGGRYEATGIALRSVILAAYEIDDTRLSGGPAWLESAGFDIVAKAAAGSVPAGRIDRPSLHRLHLMLRSLLEDSFGLVVHGETKQGPSYDLVVATGGFKLRPLSDVDCSVPGPTVQGAGCGEFTRASRNGALTGPAVEVRDVAEMLTRLMGRPVMDRTGIQGFYDIDLRWTVRTDGAVENMVSREAAGNRGEGRDMTVFAALEQQLGLKLESKRGPLETVVVDQVRRPVDN